MAFTDKSSEFYIRRCLQLAKKGAGKVAPNPMVGCVIVKNGQIIGEGFHQQYGKAHAEVNAIRSVKNKNALIGSIFYVSLEPCHHYGKTPPCVDAVIAAKAKKVVIANTDPFEKVAGQSLNKLKAAGIELEINVLESQGKWLNRRFFTFVQKKRPYIILKFAKSSNGFIGRQNEQVWLTNALSSRLSHKWRSEEAAILVGSNTVLADNPSLTTRHFSGANPVRFYIDNHLRIETNLAIHDNNAPTYCFSTNDKAEGDLFLKIKKSAPYLPQLLNHIYNLNLNSLIVEGGRQLLQYFIDEGLWDEARILTASTLVDNKDGKAIEAPQLPSAQSILKHRFQSGSDEIAIFANSNNRLYSKMVL